MPYVPRLYDELFQSLLARVVTQSKLTDVSPGSVLTHLLGTVAQEMEFTEHRLQQIRDAFSFDNAEGVDLDLRVKDLPLAQIWRKDSRKASGAIMQVSITKLDTTPATLTIPPGLVYSRSDTEDVQYVQTAEVVVDMLLEPNAAATWEVGETHKFPADDDIINLGIRVVATSPGTVGNAPKETIDLLPDDVPNEIIACSNRYPATGGLGRESDNALRVRVRNYIASLSRITSAGLKYIAKTFEASDGTTWLHVSVFEPPDIPGYTEVLVDPGGSGISWDNTPPEVYTKDAAKVIYTWPHDVDQPPYFLHEAPSVEDLTDDNVYLAGFWDKNDASFDAAKLVESLQYRPLSDPKVRQMFSVPVGVNLVMSVGERGILYLNTDYKLKWSNVSIEKQLEVTGTPYVDMANIGHILAIDSFKVYTGPVAEFQAVIEGDPSDPVHSPGYRPAGTRVRIALPTIQFITDGVEVSLVLTPGSDVAEVNKNVEDVLLDYAAGLAPGAAFLVAEMYDRIMDVDAVFNVHVVKPVEDVYPKSYRHCIRIFPGVDLSGEAQLKVY